MTIEVEKIPKENKYIIKIDYYCETARKMHPEDKWIIVLSNTEPKKGIINKIAYACGPLPGHRCQKFYVNQGCDEDKTCNWQEILEVLPYCEETAKSLGAKKLSELEIKTTKESK
jgi:hypothetical protein